MGETSEVIHCDLCGAQQVVRGDSDKDNCPFCGSDEIWIEDETNEQDR